MKTLLQIVICIVVGYLGGSILRIMILKIQTKFRQHNTYQKIKNEIKCLSPLYNNWGYIYMNVAYKKLSDEIWNQYEAKNISYFQASSLYKSINKEIDKMK